MYLPLPPLSAIADELAAYRQTMRDLPNMLDHPFTIAIAWERGPPSKLRQSLLLLDIPPDHHTQHLAKAMALRRYVGQTDGKRYVRVELYDLPERFTAPRPVYASRGWGKHGKGTIVVPFHNYLIHNATLVAIKGI